ncbi:MAG: hypothetical protein NZ890_15030 [Myxococcota bacterium]|nr:hypothetical protein [Myxococcota bacterium]
MRGGARTLVLAALLPALARGAQVEVFGELRASGVALLGTASQFGPTDAPGPCGPTPPADGGAYLSGTAVLVASAPHFRHQVGLSAGYYSIVCTDSMRRPVGGLDYRGRHQLGPRTALTASLRASLDMFDRTLDLRIGTVVPEQTLQQPDLVAGTLFLLGSSELELEHLLSRRYGLRAGLSMQTLQMFADVARLSEFTTLGPMTAAQAQLTGFRLGPAHRLELTLRYRVSHFHPVTLARDKPPWAVPPAHDASARLGWERSLDARWTLRAEAGLALAHQDHLCLSGSLTGSCSIDELAPGVRGADRPPLGELPLGARTTGIFLGEAAVRRWDRRWAVEAGFTRGYEPNPWAGALDLVNRLQLAMVLRPNPDLQVRGNALVGHHGHTSPARIAPALQAEHLPFTAPQNRTMIMFQGALAVDWAAWGSVAWFVQADAQVFAIRGEAVLDRDSEGTARSVRQVGAFPQEGEVFQTLWRLGLQCGIRLQRQESPREQGLLQAARAIP